MVSNVAELTRSMRESVIRRRTIATLDSVPLADRHRVISELKQHGRSEYTDLSGQRYRIERKPS